MADSCWLVSQGEYSAYSVLAAFPTEAAAQAHADIINEHRGADADEARVEAVPWQPDLPAIPAGMYGLSVTMTPDGTVVIASRVDTFGVIRRGTSVITSDFRRLKRTNPDIWRNYPDVTLNVKCLARDERHAVKITNEKRIQLLAGPEPWPPPEPKPTPRASDNRFAIRVSPPSSAP